MHKHLELTFGKQVHRPSRALQALYRQPLRYPGLNVGRASSHCAHRPQEFARRASLRQVAERASLHRAPWVTRILVRRQHQDARSGIACKDSVDRFQTPHPWHRDVDNQYVRTQLEIEAEGLLSAVGFADNAALACRLEQKAKAHPYNGVVVGEQDGRRSITVVGGLDRECHARSRFHDGRQWQSRMQGEAARADLGEREAATEGLYALAHTAHAKATGLVEIGFRHASAVVFHRKRNFVPGRCQINGAAARLRVLDDVGETLLDDAIERNRHFTRYGAEIPACYEIDGEPAVMLAIIIDQIA